MIVPVGDFGRLRLDAIEAHVRIFPRLLQWRLAHGFKNTVAAPAQSPPSVALVQLSAPAGAVVRAGVVVTGVNGGDDNDERTCGVEACPVAAASHVVGATSSKMGVAAKLVAMLGSHIRTLNTAEYAGGSQAHRPHPHGS